MIATQTLSIELRIHKRSSRQHVVRQRIHFPPPVSVVLNHPGGHRSCPPPSTILSPSLAMPAIIRSTHETWAASVQRRTYPDPRLTAHTSSPRDVRDDFPQALDVHYHIQLPSLSMHSNHNPSRAEHIYPNPSIPSSSVHVRQPHDFNVRMPQTIPPTSQGSHHHPSWQHAPYVRIPPLLPPPPVPHKVWILDCKSCGNFLTNRGMKVSAFSLYLCFALALTGGV